MFCIDFFNLFHNFTSFSLLGLTGCNIGINIDFPQKLMNSTFLDIVLSGEKYPDLAFYEANKEAIENKQLFFKKVW